MQKLKNTLIKATPLIIFIFLWEYVISSNSRNIFLYSKPSLVIHALIDNLINGVLINDVKITGLETLCGFLLGNTIGLVLGFLLWYSNWIAFITRPYIIAIGAIPIFSLAPMTIMWFGTGFLAKVMLAALSTFTIALVQSYSGAQNVDIDQLNLMKTFGASRFTIFKKVIMPSSVVWVLSSLRLNIGFALLGSFIGEFITAEAGLGFRILKASSLYNTSLVFASILCLIFLAFLFNWLIGRLEINLQGWRTIEIT